MDNLVSKPVIIGVTTKALSYNLLVGLCFVSQMKLVYEAVPLSHFSLLSVLKYDYLHLYI